jgi:hypothetical protein
MSEDISLTMGLDRLEMDAQSLHDAICVASIMADTGEHEQYLPSLIVVIREFAKGVSSLAEAVHAEHRAQQKGIAA